MIFSRKKVLVEYTEEQCTKCQTVARRKFVLGDTLFAELSKCSSCGGIMRIEKIYCDVLE